MVFNKYFSISYLILNILGLKKCINFNTDIAHMLKKILYSNRLYMQKRVAYLYL